MRRFVVGSVAVDFVLILFVSIAGSILFMSLLFLAARLVYIESEGTEFVVQFRHHSVWGLSRLAIEGAVALTLVVLAFVRVPLGGIFYVGS